MFKIGGLIALIQLSAEAIVTSDGVIIKQFAPSTSLYLTGTDPLSPVDRKPRDASSGFEKVHGMSGFTKSQKQQMVEITNRKRREVKPAAANMRRVIWDDELADVAQNYADQCIFQHNPSRAHSKFPQLIGENLMLVFPSNRPNLFLFNSSIIDVVEYGVNGWYAEKAYFDYENRDCVPGQECGHYITLVNWKVYRVGCGVTQCTGRSGVKTNYESGIATNPLIMVCEYSHSPIINYPPYLAGPSCTNCFDCASYSCAEEHRHGSRNCARLKRKHPTLSCSGESCYNDMCISTLRDTELFTKLPGQVIDESINLRIGSQIAENESFNNNTQPAVDSEPPVLLGDENKKLILNCLDTIRSGVRPPARKMPTTIWNSHMELIAAKLAGRSCNGKIDNIQDITGDLTLTANIAASKEKPREICSPIKYWAIGKKYYRFPKGKKGGYCKKPRKSKQADSAESCKDYARVISESADRVGCAYNQCVDKTHRFVCVFQHTYKDFKQPYEHGKWCSACPKDRCVSSRLCDNQLL